MNNKTPQCKVTRLYTVVYYIQKEKYLTEKQPKLLYILYICIFGAFFTRPGFYFIVCIKRRKCKVKTLYMTINQQILKNEKISLSICPKKNELNC